MHLLIGWPGIPDIAKGGGCIAPCIPVGYENKVFVAAYTPLDGAAL